MILYIAIAAATVLAAVIVNREEGSPGGSRGALLQSSCLFLIALILIVPAVLRQETGNDYLRYVEFFHLASIDAYVPTEAGFNLLAKVVYRLCGYENYLLLFGIYAVLTILLMLLALRQQAEDYALSFFLFMMFGYYFQSFNTMRYYFALSIALVALTCLLRRRYLSFVLLIGIAALFHKTALVTLILYPLTLVRWRKIHVAAATVLGGLTLLFHDKVLQLLLVLYPSWEGTGDLAAGTSVSWVNIAKCAAVLALALLVRRWNHTEMTERPTADGMSVKITTPLNPQEMETGVPQPGCGAQMKTPTQAREDEQKIRQLRVYWNSTLFGLGLYVFGWFVPEISRICYYLTFSQVFLIPMLLHRIPENEKGTRRRKVLTGLVLLAGMLYFAMFLKTAYRDTIKLLPYKSFLFHELNQTPSGSVG